MSAPLVVKDQIEIDAPTSKVWEVLTKTDYYRQWDELPESFTAESLELGTVIDWEGYSTMTVTECESNSKLKLSLFMPKVPLQPGEYDVSYTYKIAGSGNYTILSVEIGDFSPLPEATKYFEASQHFVEASLLKIRELSEEEY